MKKEFNIGYYISFEACYAMFVCVVFLIGIVGVVGSFAEQEKKMETQYWEQITVEEAACNSNNDVCEIRDINNNTYQTYSDVNGARTLKKGDKIKIAVNGYEKIVEIKHVN